MATEVYNGRDIQVITFDDATSGEFVIEFVDPSMSATDSAMAVINFGSNWETAKVSLSPRVDSVSVDLMVWHSVSRAELLMAM